MTTYASDSFDRADSTTTLGNSDGPGSLTWTTISSTMGILSNKAYVVSGAGPAHFGATLSVAQADCAVSADLTLSSTLNRAAVAILVRYADASNWIRVFLFKTTAIANSVYVQQMRTGVVTVLADVTSAGLVNGNTYNLKAVISGTTIEVFLDGVQKVAPTSFNSGLTTQKYGIALYRDPTDYDDLGSRWDNFLVTDNAAVGAAPLSTISSQAVQRASLR